MPNVQIHPSGFSSCSSDLPGSNLILVLSSHEAPFAQSVAIGRSCSVHSTGMGAGSGARQAERFYLKLGGGVYSLLGTRGSFGISTE